VSVRSRLTARGARLLICGALLAIGPACGLLSAPAVPNEPSPGPSPTLLPPPRAFSSPEPSSVGASTGSPSPVAAQPAGPPTPIPPPSLSSGAAGSDAAAGERAKVVNTEGQGANMRADPSPTGALVRTIDEGTELEVIGADREGGGRSWRNVRDPASGASGWIVTDLLEPVAAAAAPPPPPGPGASPAAAPKPAVAASPAAAKPAREPKPAASPGAGDLSIVAKPAPALDDADRAYLSVLQTQIDAFGKAITAANEQIERTGGRPETVNDPGWQKDTQAVAQSLTDAAGKIRAASPGPATGEVQRYANNAADRADEAANGLTSAIQSQDARQLNGVRTSLVRMLAEINNMNLALLNLE